MSIFDRLSAGYQHPFPPRARKACISVPFRAFLLEHGQAGTLFISAMTIAEIESGIRGLQRRSGSSGRSAALRAWLDGILSDFQDRILPMDAETAVIVGIMTDETTAMGRHPGLADIIIAATARANDVIVVTDNTKHFKPLGVALYEPG